MDPKTAAGMLHAIAEWLDPATVANPPPAPVPVSPPGPRLLAWGAKVSPTFRERVRWIGDELAIEPDWLMACMAFETGRRFTANVRNPSSSATGLIQFMRGTAIQLGTTVEALAAMTPEDQLNYVYKYFAPWQGKIRTLADCYMVILWPKAVGAPGDEAIFVEGTSAYAVNAGLDADKDHKVTKAEAAARVTSLLNEGRLPQNAA